MWETVRMDVLQSSEVMRKISCTTSIENAALPGPRSPDLILCLSDLI